MIIKKPVNNINFKVSKSKNPFSEKLEKEYKDIQLKSWNQFYKNFVTKAFEMNDKEHTEYLKSIRCPFGFIGKASNAKEIYESVIQIKNLDEELKKTISIMASGDLFLKKRLTVSEWLTSKNGKILKQKEIILL